MKKLKERILKLNLNPRNELIIFILISLVGIASAISVFIFLKSWSYSAIAILITLVVLDLYYQRYSFLEEEKRKRLENEFVEMFSYLRI